MKNSKLFQLLNAFSPEELQRFELFLKSPYFNTQPIFIKLFKVLEPLLNNNQLEKTEEAIFAELLPNQVYNKKHLSNYTSRLSKLAEQFLITETSFKKKSETEQWLLEALLEKRQERYFMNTFNVIKRKKQHKKLYIPLYLENFKQKYILHEFKQVNYQKFSEKDFQLILDDFDIYSLLKRISLALEIISYEIVFKVSFRFAFLDTIDELVLQEPFKNNLLIQIYYQAYKKYRNTTSDDDFYNFKKIIIEEKSKLDKRELKELLSSAINYSNVQIARGKPSFMNESLSIYILMDKYKLLFQEKFNILNDYRNIVSIACRKGDFEWVKNFIERNKQIIDEKYRTGTYHFGMGAYYFYQKDFEQAIKHFNKTYDVSDLDIYYEMNRRYVYIRCIYEAEKEYKNQFFEAVQVLQVNKNWFNRQRRIISQQLSKAYADSTGLLINLYKIKYNITDSKVKKMNALERVKQRINELDMVIVKEWYLEKIKELEAQLNKQR